MLWGFCYKMTSFVLKVNRVVETGYLYEPTHFNWVFLCCNPLKTHYCFLWLFVVFYPL